MTQGNYPTPYPAPPSPQYPHPQYPAAAYGATGYGAAGYGAAGFGAAPHGAAPGYGFPAPVPLKHSGLGILSLVLAALSGAAMIVTLIIAAVMSANDPTLFDNDQAPATIALGAAVILGAFASLVGVGLGIGGLVDKNRKKVFPAIGVAFNALIILAVVGLMVLGALAK